MSTRLGYGQLLTEDTIDDGRYKIERLIGVGGMGVVYSACQISMDRRVAIKLLRTKLTGDPMMLKRFQQEAFSVSRLRHPNIITIYDYGQTKDGRMFMVMELLGGAGLNEILRKEQLTSARSLHIMAQVCEAVTEAHKASVIHRDLKPENIHVDTVGNDPDFVKVLDFGIAKILQGGEREIDKPVTQAGTVFGTPQYMSPEQVHGRAVDHRSDIYSLGIILFELISGRTPFEGTSNIETMLAQISRPLPDIIDLCPNRAGIEEIASLIKDCTAKDVNERLESAQGMLHRIQAIAPLVADDSTTPPKVQSSNGETALAETAYEVGSGDAGEHLDTASTEADEAAAYDFGFESLSDGDMDAGPPGVTPSPAVFSGQLNPTGIPRPVRKKPSVNASRWFLALMAVGIAGLAAYALQDPISNDGPRPTPAPQKIVASKSSGAPVSTTFRVSSLPPGARVYVGDRQVGTTPLDRQVARGRTEMGRMELDGYESSPVVLTGSARKSASFVVSLTRHRAWIAFESAPAGASVTIQESVIGVTPFEWRPPTASTPAMARFERNGYQPQTRAVAIDVAGDTAKTVTIQLKRVRKNTRHRPVDRPVKNDKRPRPAAHVPDEKPKQRPQPRPKKAKKDPFEKL